MHAMEQLPQYKNARCKSFIQYHVFASLCIIRIQLACQLFRIVSKYMLFAGQEVRTEKYFPEVSEWHCMTKIIIANIKEY
jgi:hypothetical protein